jgi:hypothetical protein
MVLLQDLSLCSFKGLKVNNLKKLYDYNEKTKSFIIKVSVNTYMELFNEMDHSPIKKKDINQDVINYIEDCSKDIDLKYKINIEFKINGDEKNEKLELRTINGLENHFEYLYNIHKKNSRSVINTSILYALIFLFLVLLVFWLEAFNLPMEKILFRTIYEGISIGSWVFLWEAIVNVLIKNKTNVFLMKTYKRLIHCKLYFIHNPDEEYI